MLGIFPFCSNALPPSLSLPLICVIFFCFQSSYVLSSATVQLKRPQAKLEEEEEEEDVACATTVLDDKTSVRPTSHEKATTNRQERKKNYTVRSCKRSSSCPVLRSSFLSFTSVLISIQFNGWTRDGPGPPTAAAAAAAAASDSVYRKAMQEAERTAATTKIDDDSIRKWQGNEKFVFVFM